VSAVLSSVEERRSQCPLCLSDASTSVCAECALESHLIGVEPPDPDATRDEVLAWAEEHGVTALGARVRT